MNKSSSGARAISHDRPVFEQEIDTYRVKGKLSDPTVCKVCKAVFHNGRWQWIARYFQSRWCALLAM